MGLEWRRAARLALVCVAALGTAPGCELEGGSSELSGGAGASLGGGTVQVLLGGERQGYLLSPGLFSFTSRVIALGPSGEPRWSVELPGFARDALVGSDGSIYVAFDDRVIALADDGRRLAFDGAGRGRLAWHPWGMLAIYGEGVVVVDESGDPVLQGLTGVDVLAVAFGDDGSAFVLADETATERGDVTISKYDERLELQWWATLGATGPIAVADVALGADIVVATAGGIADARDRDGGTLWAASNASGRLAIDEQGTTYISGAGSGAVAIARGGEILWQRQARTEMSLIAGGLAAMTTVSNAIGTHEPALAALSRATGEVVSASVFDPLTELLAPVVIGGRLVGVGHTITTFTGASAGGGLAASQDATLYVASGPGAKESGAPWPRAGGPGGRRALPVGDVVPDGAALEGLWVARHGTRVRALQLAPEAWDFGILNEPAYGLFDYDSRQTPRLVQVGRWSALGDRLELEPLEDLTGGAGQASLRVYASPPGTLRLDDPLQAVTRRFSRRARLPPASSAADSVPTLEWMYGESGPSDRNALSLVAPGPGGALWVTMAYDYQGQLGGRRFLGSNIRLVGPNLVTGNLHNEVVALLTPEGVAAHVYHIDTPAPERVQAIVPEGDGIRLYGPFGVGTDVAELVYSALARPAGAELSLSQVVPWPQPDDQGRPLRPLASHALPAGGMLYAGARGVSDDAARQAVVARLDASGHIRWEQPLGAPAGATLDAVVASGTSVFVLGAFEGTLAAAGEQLRGRGVSRTFVARLDLETGQVLAARALGEGGLAGARAAAWPEGGFVVGGQPKGRFATGLATLRADEGWTRFAVTAFDADLTPAWTRTFVAPDASSWATLTALLTDDAGRVVLAGPSHGSVLTEGGAVGGPERRMPLLELSPCGDVLSPRYLRGHIEVDGAALGTSPSGQSVVHLVGGYRSDLIEPPFSFAFQGKLPTPSSPSGGTNNLALTLARATSPSDAEWSEWCSPPAAKRSTLRVNLQGVGAGRVVSDPPGIDCPGACEASFDDLTAVALVATPEPGSSFSGLSANAFGAASCPGLGPCEVLMVEDTELRAYFDASTLDWATALADGPVGAVDAASGVVAVAVGATVEVFSGGARVGARAFSGLSSGIRSVSVADDGSAVAAGVPGSLLAELVPGAPSGGSGVVVLEPDGQVRWARHLPNPTTWHEALVAFSGAEVVVTWATKGPVSLDALDVEAGEGAIARLDGATGAALALLGLGERATSVGADGAEGVWIRGGGALGGAAAPVPGVVFDGPAFGPWFVTLDDTLAVTGSLRWRTQTPTVPTLNLVTSEESPRSHYHLDATLLPRFGVRVPNAVAVPRASDPGPARLLVADGYFGAIPLPVWDAEQVRMTLLAVDPGARPAAAFVTPIGDEVQVEALATWDDTVYAVGTARTLRAPGGAPVWAQDEARPVVFAVRMAEVQP